MYIFPKNSHHCCFLECELHYRHNTEKNVKFLCKEIKRPMADGSHWKVRVRDTKTITRVLFLKSKAFISFEHNNSEQIKQISK